VTEWLPPIDLANPMIGLKRGMVHLSPYDPGWAHEYVKEKETVLSACTVSILRIAHVGSTAVPGIKAKPLIDIAVEVEDGRDVDVLAHDLADYGYTYFGDREDIGDFFLAKGPERERTHYIHVSTRQSSRFDELVFFRDRLREDTRLAREYGQLKEVLAIEYCDRRTHYTQGKEPFIRKVLKGFSPS